LTDILRGSAPELLERIVACFREERVPYVLIGAWALSVWGTSRATNDVDFLVLVDEERLSRVSDRVIEAGFELDETWLHWNPMLRGVQLRFQFHGVAVDLLRLVTFTISKSSREKGKDAWIGATTGSCLRRTSSFKSFEW
jgi:hypothetical protein